MPSHVYILGGLVLMSGRSYRRWYQGIVSLVDGYRERPENPRKKSSKNVGPLCENAARPDPTRGRFADQGCEKGTGQNGAKLRSIWDVFGEGVF
jgi:hypothetical protein